MSRALSLRGHLMALVGVALVGVAAASDAGHVLDAHHRSGVLFFAGLVLGVAGLGLRLLGSSRPASDRGQSSAAPPEALAAVEGPVFTGGAWIGSSPHRHLSATSPFATLTFGDQALRIRLDFTGRAARVVLIIYLFGKIFRLNRSYELPYGAIERVSVQLRFNATGVRIEHRAGVPAFVLFWTRDWQAILRQFEQRGVSVDSAASASVGSG